MWKRLRNVVAVPTNSRRQQRRNQVGSAREADLINVNSSDTTKQDVAAVTEDSDIQVVVVVGGEGRDEQQTDLWGDDFDGVEVSMIIMEESSAEQPEQQQQKQQPIVKYDSTSKERDSDWDDQGPSSQVEDTASILMTAADPNIAIPTTSTTTTMPPSSSSLSGGRTTAAKAKRHGSIWHKSITASQEFLLDNNEVVGVDDGGGGENNSRIGIDAAAAFTKRAMRSRASLIRLANNMEFDDEASFD